MVVIENKETMKGSLEFVKNYLNESNFAFDGDRQCIVLKRKQIINGNGYPICGVVRNGYNNCNVSTEFMSKGYYWTAHPTASNKNDVAVFDFPLTPNAEKYVKEFLRELRSKFIEFWENN